MPEQYSMRDQKRHLKEFSYRCWPFRPALIRRALRVATSRWTRVGVRRFSADEAPPGDSEVVWS
jgi:hypothetical protein